MPKRAIPDYEILSVVFAYYHIVLIKSGANSNMPPYFVTLRSHPQKTPDRTLYPEISPPKLEPIQTQENT
jgi:hypothetical protein